MERKLHMCVPHDSTGNICWAVWDWMECLVCQYQLCGPICTLWVEYHSVYWQVNAAYVEGHVRTYVAEERAFWVSGWQFEILTWLLSLPPDKPDTRWLYEVALLVLPDQCISITNIDLSYLLSILSSLSLSHMPSLYFLLLPFFPILSHYMSVLSVYTWNSRYAT